MPYPLSFADEFFSNGDLDGVRPSDRPTTVYQAILSLNDETWAALARDVFGVESDVLDPLTVLSQVSSTNICDNLDSPVHVWIDDEGWFSVLVYEERK